MDRINKSVYLGSPKATALAELEQWLKERLKEQGGSDDSLLVLPVTADQVQRIRVYGNDQLDRDDLSGDKTTLIL